MYASVRREIPEFLNEHLVFCDNLTLGKDQRSCLLLTKNLQFLQFQRKQLLRSIDLKATCLQQIAARLQDYNGPKGKWFDDQAGSADTTMHNKSSTLQEPAISFGKYLYRRFELSKLYLFIKCWDKFIVLEQRHTDFVLTCEHESVLSFKLVHGKMKYQVMVELSYKDGRQLSTNFNEHEDDLPADSKPAAPQIMRSEFKHLVERVRNAKTELQLHKAITAKEFHLLRNQQTFGCNFLRSWQLEEKQMLARCGDIWVRFTPNDLLVIGVPLINNATPPNIKVLRNLKPLLDTSCARNDLHTADIYNTFSYDYKLFALKQSFDSFESVESFFESEDCELAMQTWAAEETNTLLPEGTAILLIKFRVSQVIMLKKCPLLLAFQVKKDMQTFQQEIFLKLLDFDELLQQRQQYEITFQSETLHQDFLAIAMCNQETVLHMQFASAEDMIKFEQLLVIKFNFKLLERQFQAADVNAMDISDSEERSMNGKTQLLLYNDVPHSMWHGLLLLRTTAIGDDTLDESNLNFMWKLYTPNEEKLYLLLKILLNDLLVAKCNIVNIECLNYAVGKQNKQSVLEFETALRLELKQLLDIFNNRRSDFANYSGNDMLELLSLQFKSDLLALKLKQ